MKKVYFVFLCIALLACNDDDDDAPTPSSSTDKVAPVVTITAPAANDSLLIIGGIRLSGIITEEWRLEKVRFFLTDPGGAREMIWDASPTLYVQQREFELGHQLPIPRQAALGAYTLTVEARDYGKNVAKDSVTFVLHAPDINKAAFEEPFNLGLYNYWEYMDWFGYNSWDYGSMLDADWLSVLLSLIVDTDGEYGVSKAEWTRFTTDFNAKEQNWATWDEDNNGALNEAEFHKGVGSLKFFEDWDTDQDQVVSAEEMGAGFFERWDHNRNGLLSADEYLDRYYTYLHRAQ
ncbi:EF-hand domain-containing protein [Pontibacter chinhatensis]|nr:hypothetical protein [Pontibacter chinhatensis]